MQGGEPAHPRRRRRHCRQLVHWTADAFEVVIAKGDVKLRHLARDSRCVPVVFEIIRPFRGVEARGVAELVEGDVMSVRAAIAGRYLGVEWRALRHRTALQAWGAAAAGPDGPRVWDLSGILPS
jgi:hypothetical protein